ncbi:TlpA family protein disulfide reductase [Vicingaceae bacterium]|jgi:thiol-disulfide isomerase/thioredoxin|nr:TlpA family protein disulfide reductase [Vicingaceae bacterium]
MRILTLFLLLSLFATKSNAQVKVYETFNEFEKDILLPNNNDTTYVINFWATWCVPCVKELPYFEELNTKYANQKVKICLVSLDFPDQVDSRVIPFLKKKNIKNNVVLLADSKTNVWIDKVDPSWSGSIPITLFLKGESKSFYEKDYHNLDGLETDLLKLKKQ